MTLNVIIRVLSTHASDSHTSHTLCTNKTLLYRVNAHTLSPKPSSFLEKKCTRSVSKLKADAMQTWQLTRNRVELFLQRRHILSGCVQHQKEQQPDPPRFHFFHSVVLSEKTYLTVIGVKEKSVSLPARMVRLWRTER